MSDYTKDNSNLAKSPSVGSERGQRRAFGLQQWRLFPRFLPGVQRVSYYTQREGMRFLQPFKFDAGASGSY